MEELEGQGLELSGKIDAPVTERCTILIVSRSYDLVAPLLHEFTYQVFFVVVVVCCCCLLFVVVIIVVIAVN